MLTCKSLQRCLCYFRLVGQLLRNKLHETFIGDVSLLLGSAFMLTDGRRLHLADFMTTHPTR